VATTVVFSGGPTQPGNLARAMSDARIGADTRPELVIAADGGLLACREAGLAPDVVIGDMDSVPAAQLRQADLEGARIEVHPRDKDATDLELALDLAGGQSTDRLVVIGSGGGRLDHLLAGITLLGAPQYAAMQIDAWLGVSRVVPVHDRRTIDADPGATLSLLALHGTAPDVSTEGLRWELEHGILDSGRSRGCSNIVQSPPVEVCTAGTPVTVVIADHALTEPQHWNAE